MHTKNIEKTYKDYNLAVARYLLITILLQLHKNTSESAEQLHLSYRGKFLYSIVTTNMLYSLFSDALILPRNLHLIFEITVSASKQLNISRHVSIISWDLASNVSSLRY